MGPKHCLSRPFKGRGRGALCTDASTKKGGFRLPLKTALQTEGGFLESVPPQFERGPQIGAMPRLLLKCPPEICRGISTFHILTLSSESPPNSQGGPQNSQCHATDLPPQQKTLPKIEGIPHFSRSCNHLPPPPVPQQNKNRHEVCRGGSPPAKFICGRSPHATPVNIFVYKGKYFLYSAPRLPERYDVCNTAKEILYIVFVYFSSAAADL